MTAPARQARRPGDGLAIVANLAKSVAWAGLILLLLAVWFALYFLVPQFEEYCQRAGFRPPLAGRLLIGVSHVAVNYWWVVALAGFLVWAAASRAGSSRPVGQPD